MKREGPRELVDCQTLRMAHISSVHVPLCRVYCSDCTYGQERLESSAYLFSGNRGNEFAKKLTVLVRKVDERKAPHGQSSIDNFD